MFFFVFFFCKPATFYRFSHTLLYRKSRNETSERMWDLYISTSHPSKKKSEQTSKGKRNEGQWLISWKHCSACLIEALFPISLCTWGLDRAFPRVHCEAQLQADETLTVYICLLHPVWPSLLSLPLIAPLSLCQHESVLWDLNKQAGLAFCSLFLTKMLMHLDAFLSGLRELSTGALLYFSHLSSSGCFIKKYPLLVNSTLYR